MNAAEKSLRVAAAKQDLMDMQANYKMAREEREKAERAVAWANSIGNPAPFDKVAYDAVYARQAEAQARSLAAWKGYLAANEAYERELGRKVAKG